MAITDDVFSESLTVDRAIGYCYLAGGNSQFYDERPNNAFSTIKGKLTIKSGRVIADKIIISGP